VPPLLPPCPLPSLQGHAGTVPMRIRRDPMAASAEIMAQLERICNGGNRSGAAHRWAGWGGVAFLCGLGCRWCLLSSADLSVAALISPASGLPISTCSAASMPPTRCSAELALDESLVCTVGSLSIWPNAGNVIPG
jgi:hypothetical protein